MQHNLREHTILYTLVGNTSLNKCSVSASGVKWNNLQLWGWESSLTGDEVSQWDVKSTLTPPCASSVSWKSAVDTVTPGLCWHSGRVWLLYQTYHLCVRRFWCRPQAYFTHYVFCACVHLSPWLWSHVKWQMTSLYSGQVGITAPCHCVEEMQCSTAIYKTSSCTFETASFHFVHIKGK